MKLKILFAGIVGAIFFSCSSVPKDMLFFQDIDGKQQKFDAIHFFEAEPVLLPNDRLFITVSAPIFNQDKVAQFNLPLATFLRAGTEEVSTATSALQTYLVESDGAISYPILGKVKIGGLTVSKATEKIKQEIIATYPDMANVVVNLQVTNFRVYVSGEVNAPRAIDVSNSRISILDAIGEAGGLNQYADRKNILLIRNNNDKIEHYRFDITKTDLFASPYFYLHQNDLVVVEPNKTKQKDSRVSSADSFRMSVMSFALSAVSVIASTLLTLRALNQ